MIYKSLSVLLLTCRAYYMYSHSSTHSNADASPHSYTFINIDIYCAETFYVMSSRKHKQLRYTQAVGKDCL